MCTLEGRRPVGGPNQRGGDRRETDGGGALLVAGPEEVREQEQRARAEMAAIPVALGRMEQWQMHVPKPLQLDEPVAEQRNGNQISVQK